jgi:hypothetical protein
VARDKDQWRSVVGTVIVPSYSIKTGEFLQVEVLLVLTPCSVVVKVKLSLCFNGARHSESVLGI